MLQKKHSFRLAVLSIAGLFLSATVTVAWAQFQDSSAPSVAEAARRAREQRKNAAKPVRTLTNDDLPAARPAGSTSESPVATPENAPEKTNENAQATNASEEPAAPLNDEQARQKKAENAVALERTKKELSEAQSELDVMQRRAALDSDGYYSKPDFASDKEGKANLDAQAQQVSDKKQLVETLKTRVAELEALVGEPAPVEPDKNPPH